jgi:hypothetical protein
MFSASECLWEELSELADAFADSARGLLHASREMHAPGRLPSAALLEELHGLEGRFERLRERSFRLAKALGVAFSEVKDLRDLARLVESLEEAESRRRQSAPHNPSIFEVVDAVRRLLPGEGDEGAGPVGIPTAAERVQDARGPSTVQIGPKRSAPPPAASDPTGTVWRLDSATGLPYGGREIISDELLTALVNESLPHRSVNSQAIEAPSVKLGQAVRDPSRSSGGAVEGLRSTQTSQKERD